MSPSPADPVTAAEQDALGAYRGMWEAYDLAGRPPVANPNDPRLEEYATGDALQKLVAGLASMRDAGLVFEGEAQFSPEVVELSPQEVPTRARIEDCADSSDATRVRADGEPFEDQPGGFRLVIADVEEVGGGVWKVTDFAVREVGSCGG